MDRTAAAGGPRLIELIYFDAGGGHRMTMRALCAAPIPEWQSQKLVATNLQSVLAPVDPIHRASGIASEDVYNFAIRRGWTRGSKPLLRALQQGIKFNQTAIKRRLMEHWSEIKPDLVVSLVPNFNSVMLSALSQCHPGVPFVTVMTDLSDSPPDFWLVPQDQYVICGSSKAFTQARTMECFREDQVFKSSGMIIHPSFYQPIRPDCLRRSDIGLDEDTTTVLAMFGGTGSRQVSRLLRAIEASDLNIQVIVMCGKDRTLLKELVGRARCHPVPFTDRVADYMRLADIYIGKPGPGSLSEALQMGLPAIVESNARTMIQERYNVTWIEERELGLSIASFDDIAPTLRLMTQPQVLASYKRRAASVHNQALFEVPRILLRILEKEDFNRGRVPISSEWAHVVG